MNIKITPDGSRFKVELTGTDFSFTTMIDDLPTLPGLPGEPEPPPPSNSGKIDYAVSNGVVIAGVNANAGNRIILDNDFATDSPEFPLMFLAADKGRVNLTGLIMHSTLDPAWNFERTQGHWATVMKQASGLKNIPTPVKGSSRELKKPSNGNIDSTVLESSPGADLIIQEAKLSTPEKPLVIFMGGQSSTVANAYLKDNTIADRVVLFHINGYWNGGTDGYNTADEWATYILIKRMKYVCVNVKFPENRKYWYDGKNMGLSQTLINNIPAHQTKSMLDKWFKDAYAREGLADSPAVLWYFNNKLWKNVVRKKENGQITTGNDYDFLFVTEHDWPGYGATLINTMKELL